MAAWPLSQCQELLSGATVSPNGPKEARNMASLPDCRSIAQHRDSLRARWSEKDQHLWRQHRSPQSAEWASFAWQVATSLVRLQANRMWTDQKRLSTIGYAGHSQGTSVPFGGKSQCWRKWQHHSLRASRSLHSQWLLVATHTSCHWDTHLASSRWTKSAIQVRHQRSLPPRWTWGSYHRPSRWVCFGPRPRQVDTLLIRDLDMLDLSRIGLAAAKLLTAWCDLSVWTVHRLPLLSCLWADLLSLRKKSHERTHQFVGATLLLKEWGILLSQSFGRQELSMDRWHLVNVHHALPPPRWTCIQPSTAWSCILSNLELLNKAQIIKAWGFRVFGALFNYWGT